MVAKLGFSNTPRKELEMQVNLQHPLLNHMASDNQEGVLDPFAPVVTSLSEKAMLGFSMPVEKKKSRERLEHLQHYTHTTGTHNS